MCCVSPALHTLGFGSRLEFESLHWLQTEIPAHSLGCCNLLCALKLVAIRNKSCSHCCCRDHTKPTKTSSMRKCSEHCDNEVLYLLQVSFTLFCFSWNNVVSPLCSSILGFLLAISPCFKIKLPSHELNYCQILCFLSLLVFCFLLAVCLFTALPSKQQVCLLTFQFLSCLLFFLLFRLGIHCKWFPLVISFRLCIHVLYC